MTMENLKMSSNREAQNTQFVAELTQKISPLEYKVSLGQGQTRLVCAVEGHKDIQSNRETERQKDRKTERQKDRKTEGQKDRKTEGQKDRRTERQKDRKRHKDRKIERQKDID